MELMIGLAFVLLALGLALGIVFRPARVAVDRRAPVDVPPTTGLSRLAGGTTGFLENLLARRKLRIFSSEALESAGLRLRQSEFLVLMASAALVAMVLGMLLAGPSLGVLFFLLVPALGHLHLQRRTAKRRHGFGEQLVDTLQLLSGSLRAGHSILRAMDAAALESPAPTSEEMRRIVSETSLGRDLLASLNDTATRMQSEDFRWIAQAVQINREVGGNLAEVLDQVNETIRERSEIKGQIASLAAEGKFSAYILMAMPVGIIAMLMVISPGYMTPLFTQPLGWVMMGASVVLMTVGGLWMRKIIDLKF
ncbi:type II secretion system F family protein [Paeniglutamicibacter sulfureus]|uniref:Tight adherence protein B n=1 Tax=Paeniglutamicibacter sulfureus TaxID=43666 RepID=A0ABU2BMW5_9MICC|nr:type II secretion system F family protein [Paeniglutamicibacter sulfureus]MDR7359970.1 tight adherence protein B [Paeniglutamicibacter sulfureus]